VSVSVSASLSLLIRQMAPLRPYPPRRGKRELFSMGPSPNCGVARNVNGGGSPSLPPPSCLLLFRCCDLDINHMTLKLESDLDMLTMYLHTENEVARLRHSKLLTVDVICSVVTRNKSARSRSRSRFQL